MNVEIDLDFIEQQLSAETELQAAIEQALRPAAELANLPIVDAAPLPTGSGFNDIRVTRG